MNRNEKLAATSAVQQEQSPLKEQIKYRANIIRSV